ncbi:hypothetical protein SARC_08386 [Sphaeroforma arctica JP610]|uniref:Uncharacterized protein n=1 Tax=Sphaeroforma arctica JP610 TaxID=667725 RepID=A0A0L0FQY4_9EUKA|nr:hypothetical protein SARC_08386 [Sphaeroforma arctica JP610]KNC79217.1 hypothetical protein SARC_08386 [Sphaeroforma arctica JP610]|eukprot:XP_014153119.1 hypothetical protein SARC_08386 [Sphaeroforma arctica JP610]
MSTTPTAITDSSADKRTSAHIKFYSVAQERHTDIIEHIQKVGQKQIAIQKEAETRERALQNVQQSLIRADEDDQASLQETMRQLPFYASKTKRLAQDMKTLTQQLRDLSQRANALKASDYAMRQESSALSAVVSPRLGRS